VGRRAINPPMPAAPTGLAVHRVHPTAVYFVDTFRKLFRLKESSLRREVREGRLRIAKRCNRYYLLGRWILEWLESAEVKRNGAGRLQPDTAAEAH
jgi:hypothetical protein